MYDIIYFKGNPNSGSYEQHTSINTSIISLIDNYNYVVLDSEAKNLSGINIAQAKIYIGFSRGSRYLKKLPQDRLKISIGGVKSSKTHLFKNSKDEILLGNISESSLGAHFIIEEQHQIEIKSLINDFMINL
ncbi:MAG: hypothetical protein WA945_05110 [Arcobacteraceae bacterium]